MHGLEVRLCTKHAARMSCDVMKRTDCAMHEVAAVRWSAGRRRVKKFLQAFTICYTAGHGARETISPRTVSNISEIRCYSNIHSARIERERCDGQGAGDAYALESYHGGTGLVEDQSVFHTDTNAAISSVNA